MLDMDIRMDWTDVATRCVYELQVIDVNLMLGPNKLQPVRQAGIVEADGHESKNMFVSA
jgi:hypothetical protein